MDTSLCPDRSYLFKLTWSGGRFAERTEWFDHQDKVEHRVAGLAAMMETKITYTIEKHITERLSVETGEKVP